MNFRRALVKLNQLKPHIMSKINIINLSKNTITNAFNNCISSLSDRVEVPDLSVSGDTLDLWK
jgi:hypothetical protein